MTPSIQLAGIHSRSEPLIELTRSYDRGRTPKADLLRQLEEDTRQLVKLQESLGFENISDGALEWQDQLRPLVASLRGVEGGSRYSRWFDTNTFYQKPIVTGKIGVGNFKTENFVRADLLPKAKGWKVTVVGPYTFSELSENRHYNEKSDLIRDVAHAEREIFKRLHARGVTYIQLSEPCLVYQPYRARQAQSEELETALDAIQETVDGVPSNFAVQTYFGDASEILPKLLKLPVHAVGFDIFETDYATLNLETSKRLAFGVVDSRDSNVEDPSWIAETATQVTKHVSSPNLILAPSCDLKFVPRQVADAKAQALARATKLFQEE